MLALANSTQFLVWMKSPLTKSDKNEKGLLCSIRTTQKWSSPLRIYSINVTQSAGIWGYQVLTMATKNNTYKIAMLSDPEVHRNQRIKIKNGKTTYHPLFFKNTVDPMRLFCGAKV